jgi:hypothetical protein
MFPRRWRGGRGGDVGCGGGGWWGLGRVEACLVLDLFVGDYVEGAGVELVGYKEVDVTAEFNHGSDVLSLWLKSLVGQEQTAGQAILYNIYGTLERYA